jgi:hypothetical protein
VKERPAENEVKRQSSPAIFKPKSVPANEFPFEYYLHGDKLPFQVTGDTFQPPTNVERDVSFFVSGLG